MTNGLRIGIDIGGSKIAAVILDKGGRELASHRDETPHEYEAAIKKITNAVFQLEQQVDRAEHIGISMPGVFSADRKPLLVANLPWLEGTAFLRDLELIFGRKIKIGNDANCFALSEAIDGAASGAEVVFGVTLGTGVGSGIVVNGRVITGANGSAGEWGHNSLPWRMKSDGAENVCCCGRIGCVETWLNGAALSRDYFVVAQKPSEAKEIARLANQGDALARKAIARYESRLARALSAAINFLDPNVIVLGGGLSKVSSFYERVPQLWSHHVTSGAKTTRLVAAVHGPDSGARGAAWL